MIATILISGFLSLFATAVIFGIVVAIMYIDARIRKPDSDYIVATKRGWTVVFALGALCFVLMTAMTTVTSVS